MADKKITELPLASGITSADVLPIVDFETSATQQASFAQISTYITQAHYTKSQIDSSLATKQNIRPTFAPIEAGQTKAIVYPGWTVAGAQGTLAVTASRVYYMPYLLSKPATIVSGAAFIVTSGLAGSLCKLALLPTNSNLQPTGVPIIYFGEVDTSTTGGKVLTVAPTSLGPGLYLGMIVSNNSPTLRTSPMSMPEMAVLGNAEPTGATSTIPYITTMKFSGFTYSSNIATFNFSSSLWTALVGNAGFQMMFGLQEDLV